MTTKRKSAASDRLRATPAPAADLLAELAAVIAADARQPGDVSIAELVAATGMSESTVRRRMERRVAEGHLVALMAYDVATRRYVRIWRRAP